MTSEKTICFQASTASRQFTLENQVRYLFPLDMANKIIIAFDAYGTLLSTESIAQELASHFGYEKGTGLAASWRRIQLEYTWRLNSMRT